LKLYRNFLEETKNYFLLLCWFAKFFGISRLVELEHTFKQKLQNEGDDNIFVNLLKEYLKETYEINYTDKNLVLSGGDFDGCFILKKAKHIGILEKIEGRRLFPYRIG